MGIVNIPPELQNVQQLLCVICRVKLLLPKATAGLFDANNHQAFACVSHFSEPELLIVGWADFRYAQRAKHNRQKLEAEALYGRVENAWPDR